MRYDRQSTRYTTFHPVTPNAFPALPIVTVRSHIFGIVAKVKVTIKPINLTYNNDPVSPIIRHFKSHVICQFVNLCPFALHILNRNVRSTIRNEFCLDSAHV